MTKRTLVIQGLACALIGAALSFAAVQASHGQQPAPSAARNYDYAIVLEGAQGLRGVDQLNRAGAQGWDLVAVTCSEQTKQCFYYLKHPK